MNSQPKEQEKASLEESSRDAGSYALLIEANSATDDHPLYSLQLLSSKKEVSSALERVGTDQIHKVRLFRGAKEVEVRTKVSFTF